MLKNQIYIQTFIHTTKKESENIYWVGSKKEERKSFIDRSHAEFFYIINLWLFEE